MKKWFKLLFPALLFVTFLLFYSTDLKRWQARDREKAAAALQAKQAHEAAQAEFRAKAAADADRKAAERRAAAEKREADRMAKWTREGEEIAQITQQAQRAADDSAKKIAQMELERIQLRDRRERENRAWLEAMKRVEQLKIEKRVTDMEVARLVKMIDLRARSYRSARST